MAEKKDGVIGFALYYRGVKAADEADKAQYWYPLEDEADNISIYTSVSDAEKAAGEVVALGDTSVEDLILYPIAVVEGRIDIPTYLKDADNPDEELEFNEPTEALEVTN